MTGSRGHPGGRLDEIAASDGRLTGPVSTVQVGEVLVIRIPLAGTGTDPASNEALETLRRVRVSSPARPSS